MTDCNSLQHKTALITGAARRIGAEVARRLHAEGANVVIHCRSSLSAAEQLRDSLNALRGDSARVLQLDLDETGKLDKLVNDAADCWHGLDILINNASGFYPTPVGSITENDWNSLFNSNLKAPLFLSQAAVPYLQQTKGCIINMVDIHAFRPMRRHPVYCAAKAGLAMLTQSLARELGPDIRVNGVAPGAIMWPEHDMDETTKQHIIERTALQRHGEPADIASAIVFLLRDAPYITGQILPVDGGRMLNM